jgi:hypothetical protein
MIDETKGMGGPSSWVKAARYSLFVLIGCLWATPLIANNSTDQTPGQPQTASTVESNPPEHEPPGTPNVLDAPLDGSSVQAFESGLAKVRSDAGEAAYKRVKAATDYLLYYRLEARKDPATLYKMLDGMSPREIVDMAARR